MYLRTGELCLCTIQAGSPAAPLLTKELCQMWARPVPQDNVVLWWATQTIHHIISGYEWVVPAVTRYWIAVINEQWRDVRKILLRSLQSQSLASTEEAIWGVIWHRICTCKHLVKSYCDDNVTLSSYNRQAWNHVNLRSYDSYTLTGWHMAIGLASLPSNVTIS